MATARVRRAFLLAYYWYIVRYMCVSSSRTFDGPADATVVDGMAKWGINAIRLPMNEDCWLGLKGSFSIEDAR